MFAHNYRVRQGTSLIVVSVALSATRKKRRQFIHGKTDIRVADRLGFEESMRVVLRNCEAMSYKSLIPFKVDNQIPY